MTAQHLEYVVPTPGLTAGPLWAQELKDADDLIKLVSVFKLAPAGGDMSAAIEDALAAAAAEAAAEGFLGGVVELYPDGRYVCQTPFSGAPGSALVSRGLGAYLDLDVADGVGLTVTDDFCLERVHLRGTCGRAISVTGDRVWLHNFSIHGATEGTWGVGLHAGSGVNDLSVEDFDFIENGLWDGVTCGGNDILIQGAASGAGIINQRVHIAKGRCRSVGVFAHMELHNLQDYSVTDIWELTGAKANPAHIQGGDGLIVYDDDEDVDTPAYVTKDGVIDRIWGHDLEGCLVYLQNSADTEIAHYHGRDVCTVKTPDELLVGGIAVNNDDVGDHAVDWGRVSVHHGRITGSGQAGATLRGRGHHIDHHTSVECLVGLWWRGDHDFARQSNVDLIDCGEGVVSSGASSVPTNFRSKNVTVRGTTGASEAGFNYSQGLKNAILDGDAAHACNGQGILVVGGDNVRYFGFDAFNNGASAPGTMSGMQCTASRQKFVGCHSGNDGTTNQKWGLTDTGAGTGNWIAGCDFSDSENVTAGKNISTEGSRYTTVS